MSNLPAKIKEVVDLRTFDNADQLLVALNSKPEGVQTNPYGGNSQYIPIDLVESSLDSIFGPMNWQINNCQICKEGAYTNQKGTEMLLFTCVLELSVLHPISHVWVTRSGAASSSASANQFETFAPKLKAEAFKNATKSLGATFGRELNRKMLSMNGYLNDVKKEEYGDFQQQLEACKTVEELSEFYKSHPMRNNPAFRNKFLQRKKQIENEG